MRWQKWKVGVEDRAVQQRRHLETYARTAVTEANEYRAYIIGPDGHIQERIELLCADDNAAKERAKALVDGHDVSYGSLIGGSLSSKQSSTRKATRLCHAASPF